MITETKENPYQKVSYSDYVIRTGLTRGCLAGIAGLGLGLIIAMVWMIMYLSDPSSITPVHAGIIGLGLFLSPSLMFGGYVGYQAVTDESTKYDYHNVTSSEKVQHDTEEQIAPPEEAQLKFQIRSYNGELHDHNHSIIEGTSIQLFNLGKWLVGMGENSVGARRDDADSFNVLREHYTQIRQLFESNNWVVKQGDATNSRVVVTPTGIRQAQANGARLMNDLGVR